MKVGMGRENIMQWLAFLFRTLFGKQSKVTYFCDFVHSVRSVDNTPRFIINT